MKNIQNMMEMLNADRDMWFAHRKDLNEATEKLETIYRETIDGTPEETIADYIKDAGREMALEVIGTLVNQSAWDGRISPDIAEWAKNLDEAWDGEMADKLHIYTNIHMAHLNQLAMALMNQ